MCSLRIEFNRPSDHLHSNAELVEQLVRNFETASAESKQNAHSSREMKQVTDTVEANARARPSTSIADATEPQKYHESLDNLPHSPGRGRALKKVRSRYSHSAEDFETARRGVSERVDAVLTDAVGDGDGSVIEERHLTRMRSRRKDDESTRAERVRDVSGAVNRFAEEHFSFNDTQAQTRPDEAQNVDEDQAQVHAQEQAQVQLQADKEVAAEEQAQEQAQAESDESKSSSVQSNETRAQDARNTLDMYSVSFTERKKGLGFKRSAW